MEQEEQEQEPDYDNQASVYEIESYEADHFSGE
jgi:hypothetical protein